MTNIPIPIKNAVIYCRVSTKEQVDDGNSLVTQERICREYAAKQGYEVISVFIEKGESAKTADRTELKNLMSFCKVNRGKIQAVIAYKVDRISRNLIDYGELRLRLKAFGTEIKSVTEFFEDTPAGRFMENIIANVGQFDNDVRTERCVGGMREAVREGRYVWMAPYGYDNVRVNGKATIAQNEKAPLMKEVFNLITKRLYSTDEIRLSMAEKGLTNKQGVPITRGNFFRLIRNPLYAGKVSKLGINVKGNFEPIVTEELFDEVQHILSGRKNNIKHYSHENPDFPLRRFIRHPSGKQLTGYWAKGKNKKYPFYSFNTAGTTYSKIKLEKAFMDFLSGFELDNQHLKVLHFFITKVLNDKTSNQAKDHTAIENRIVEINQQIDNLLKIQNGGGISMTILADRTSTLEIELESLKDLLKTRPNKEYNFREILKFAADVLRKPQLLWQKCSFERKKFFQVFGFPMGLVFDGEKFRTQEMCSIFKLKSIIDSGLLSVVNYQNTETNSGLTTNLSGEEKVLYSEDYWMNIADELERLRDGFANIIE